MPATALTAPEVWWGRLRAFLPKVFLWSWTFGFLAIIALRGQPLVSTWTRHWPDLFFWMIAVLVVDFFPVEVGERSLTLDLPLLLAVAFLYTPEAAASVAVIGALDRRELMGEVRFRRAVLNRIQIAASVLCAGYVFHAVTGSSGGWWRSAAAVVLALVADFIVNVILVSSMTISGLPYPSQKSFRQALSELHIGRWDHFLVSYLGYGMLAFSLSRLYLNPGAWSVVMLLAPLVVARQALVKTREVERVAAELQVQKTRMAQALDQIVLERRDERNLIAGELHDDVLQHVVRTRLAALTAARQLDSKIDQAEIAKLDEASKAATDGLREVIHGLRRSPLGRRGLVSALKQLLTLLENEWGRRLESELPTNLSLAPEAQFVMYQVAREALVNALKHSDAQSISLAVDDSGSSVRLTVTDDGRGLDVQRLQDEKHLGLDLLQERSESVGGQVSLQSSPNKGTRLELRIPLKPRSGTDGHDEGVLEVS